MPSSINNLFSVCRVVQDSATTERWSGDRAYILMELVGPEPYQQAVRTAKEILVKADAPSDKGLVVYNNVTGKSTMVYRDGPQKILYSNWDWHLYQRPGRMSTTTGIGMAARLPAYLRDNIW